MVRCKDMGEGKWELAASHDDELAMEAEEQASRLFGGDPEDWELQVRVEQEEDVDADMWVAEVQWRLVFRGDPVGEDKLRRVRESRVLVDALLRNAECRIAEWHEEGWAMDFNPRPSEVRAEMDNIAKGED